MDKISSARRSENMRRISSKNTKPEMQVRHLVFRLGYRYRLHRKELPGAPDLVFQKRKKVIFVHGCFWHQHGVCIDSKLPKTRQEYWVPKLHRNVERDRQHQELLRRLGWDVLVLWDCEIKDTAALAERITAFLGPVNVSESV